MFCALAPPDVQASVVGTTINITWSMPEYLNVKDWNENSALDNSSQPLASLLHLTNFITLL